MILQNITFGFVLKHFLGNDSGKAITFAGIFLLLAALSTILIKSTKVNVELDVAMTIQPH
jgi:maltose/moltooligosaccharide transporter